MRTCMRTLTCNKPGGQAVVQLPFMVLQCVFSHDLKVQDEHDHHTILVLHRHHVHRAQEALACRDSANTQTHLVGQLDLTNLMVKLTMGLIDQEKQLLGNPCILNTNKLDLERHKFSAHNLKYI